MSTIVIYTDGSSIGNPGPGGYGVVLKFNNFRKELSQGYKKTTNNRMELLAAIVALETLKTQEHEVIIYSDSKYVVDAIEKKWLEGWRKKDFKKVKNVDLWQRFYLLYKQYRPKLVWVKGHAGNVENERCDQLATQAAANPNLLIDHGYEA